MYSSFVGWTYRLWQDWWCCSTWRDVRIMLEARGVTVVQVWCLRWRPEDIVGL